ncbi:hypothetical protein SPBR_07327 [Sporothrix brasiliensis 5110]|uniref:Vacuolar iron transporter n=1 Tax=Sporothrix brasiliensis 5110 TaxID=1398154 RepID=A0A0C2IR32_9PEZI|nr:uncharacterized protein SPBR_07327 [Sporothrix brasiliensis 5110]KIH89340.1 hypothetical protein SPBR_07327 [Sporothrix brasiliensis 5110]
MPVTPHMSSSPFLSPNHQSLNHRPTSPSAASHSASSSSSASFYPSTPAGMADSTRTRQQYARLLADHGNNDDDGGGAYSPGSASVDSASEGSIQMTSASWQQRAAAKRARQARRARVAHVEKRVGCLPPARRFWADFTLGFADGLTVPFALTAGLSSLGQTDTVVYAGLAEVSAGCISMGIGGYLSARQAAARPGSTSASEDEAEGRERGRDRADVESGPEMEETKATDTPGADSLTTAHRYLAPLALPADLHRQMLAHIASQPHVAANLVAASQSAAARAAGDDDGEYGYGADYYAPPANDGRGSDGDDGDDDDAVWPVAAGASVALGYLVGGLLPLWPYFFVTHVGDGLRYSFAVCIVALFLFGFIRDFALDAPSSSSSERPLPAGRRRMPWRRLWKSTFEGVQMVILGGIAAIAAVLCVRLFEGASTSGSE